MPFPNEHSCRLENPRKYEELRRNNNHRAVTVNGKKGDAIFGILTKEGKRVSELQAGRFKIKKFSEAEARKWCRERKGRFEKAEPKDCIECDKHFEPAKT